MASSKSVFGGLILLLAAVASAQVTPPANGGTGTGTAPTAGQILVGQSNGKYLPKTATGSCTISSAGAFSCSGGGGGTPANIIYASAGNGTVAGCALNTNLLTGGGTDATTCLQAQLDWLGSNGGGELILNGPALISNATVGTTNSVDGNVQTSALQTHSNVTIFAPTGGGVFLAASSDCLMLGNNITGNPSAMFQTNMRVIGGFWNGNNANQSKYEQGNSSNIDVFGFWFGGFNGLEISGVTLYNVATFNFTISNGENFIMANDSMIATTTVPGDAHNQDGIHLWGTLSNGVISNFSDTGGDDDPFAFNTDEGVGNYDDGSSAWEYQRLPNSGGAISNIQVTGLTLDTPSDAGRFYGVTATGGTPSLTNISLRNVSGSVAAGMLNSGLTTCSNILIENWTLAESGSITPPNLTGCSSTAGQQGYGTLQEGQGSSGGLWNFLDPSLASGGDVGFMIGEQPGSGGNAGTFTYNDPSSGADYWELAHQGNSNVLHFYSNGDLSLSGSDDGTAFSLPAGGGIKQHSGGSSSDCYATDGSTPACGGSSSVSVNGSSVSNPNFNGTTPSVSGATGINNVYQVSSSNVSSYTPVATGSAPGVIKPDGTSCTVTSGVLTCTGSGGSTSPMPVSNCNGRDQSGSSLSSIETASSCAVTSGELIVAACGAGPSSSITFTPSDTLSNTWNSTTSQGVFGGTDIEAQVFWAIASSSGSDRITCTLGTASPYPAVIATVFSGAGSTLNGSVNLNNASSSTTYPNFGVLSTTQRTLDVVCLRVNSAGYTYQPQWMGIGRGEMASVDTGNFGGNGSGANTQTLACAYGVEPLADANLSGYLTYQTWPGGSPESGLFYVGAMLAFNY